jgi:hypothetical protein
MLGFVRLVNIVKRLETVLTRSNLIARRSVSSCIDDRSSKVKLIVGCGVMNLPQGSYGIWRNLPPSPPSLDKVNPKVITRPGSIRCHQLSRRPQSYDHYCFMISASITLCCKTSLFVVYISQHCQHNSPRWPHLNQAALYPSWTYHSKSVCKSTAI